MFPLRLSWQLPQDGVAADPGGNDPFFRRRSDRFIATEVTVRDLEDPAAIALANCQTTRDFEAFITRRGFLVACDGPEETSLLTGLASDFSADLELCNAPVMAKIERARQLVQDPVTVQLDVQLNTETERPEIVHRVLTLSDLMRAEIVLAYQAGAAFGRCQHCSKGFLTGYLTGRRSSSVFCSDRCRVAAMRARKKGAE